MAVNIIYRNKWDTGCQVKVKSLEWYNENKDEDGNVRYETMMHDFCFTEKMSKLCGLEFSIEDYENYSHYNLYLHGYTMLEDRNKYEFCDKFLEEEPAGPDLWKDKEWQICRKGETECGVFKKYRDCESFEIGDYVQIRSKRWYLANCDDNGFIDWEQFSKKSPNNVSRYDVYGDFDRKKSQFCGKVMKVLKRGNVGYILEGGLGEVYPEFALERFEVSGALLRRQKEEDERRERERIAWENKWNREPSRAERERNQKSWEEMQIYLEAEEVRKHNEWMDKHF